MEKLNPALVPRVLLAAYSQGYFPMPDEKTREISWYRPDPRTIIPLEQFHTSRSLHRSLRRKGWVVTFSTAFAQVMAKCADRESTWINDDFQRAYTHLHHLGGAHSVEVWLDAELVGGTYGVCLRGAFFAESMFHTATNASKVALHYLVARLRERGFSLLEVQFISDHLKSLGAVEIPDSTYIQLLGAALERNVSFV